MYAEIIKRNILTDINEDTRWWIEDSGFLVMPENDDEMKAIVSLVEKYHPDPNTNECEECQTIIEQEEKSHFDPNIG